MNPILAVARERHGDLLDGWEPLSSQLQEFVLQRERAEAFDIRSRNPFDAHEGALKLAQGRVAQGHVPAADLVPDLNAYQEFLEAARLPSDRAYWERELAALSRRPPGRRVVESMRTRDLLLQVWRRSLDQARAAWELQQIEAFRAALLDDILDWLSRVRVIRDALDALGIAPGRLLDLSSGALSPQNVAQIRRWASYLESDPGARELCDLVGRAWQQFGSAQMEKVQQCVSIDALIPDIHSREEIVGIEFGKKVAHAIAAEWMLLADPATEMLFDLKLAEARLLSFRMEGMQSVAREQVESVVDENRQRGPVIVCIDTSGSMHGTPEHIAKALSLFVAMRTQDEARPCYLINFSTEIDVLDLSSGFGLAALMDFLGKSFHGGTDAVPAIEHALETMESGDFRRADLLVISDFLMAELPEETLDTIASQREQGNRFHSLCIGRDLGWSRVRDHFDTEWVFDPSNSSVRELARIRDAVSASTSTTS